MITVTICGSMRFEKEMRKLAFFLETRHQINVLQCVYAPENSVLTESEIAALTQAHYRKIDLSDGIYVVDIGGYIGESVRREVDYAANHGKRIFYHSEYANRTEE